MANRELATADDFVWELETDGNDPVVCPATFSRTCKPEARHKYRKPDETVSYPRIRRVKLAQVYHQFCTTMPELFLPFHAHVDWEGCDVYRDRIGTVLLATLPHRVIGIEGGICIMSTRFDYLRQLVATLGPEAAAGPVEFFGESDDPQSNGTLQFIRNVD
jgi:hypothetical protein